MDITTFVHRDLGLAEMTEALGAVGLEFGEPRRSTRTVLDTFDGRLHAAEMCLQAVRSSGGVHLQLDQRDSVSATVAVTDMPRLAPDLPAGPLGNRLRAVLDVRALLPRVTFECRSATAVQRDDLARAIATVTVNDAISLPTGGEVPATVQVAPALRNPKPAERILDHLTELGFAATDHDLLGLVIAAAGVDLGGYTSTATVALHIDMPAAAGFQAVLANLADSIEANWQGTIHDLDTEFLHELRVAVRRTRSVLGQSKRVLPESLRSRFREDFAWLAGATGPTRDLDVYTLEWPKYVADMAVPNIEALRPVLEHIVRHRAAARAELVGVLESERAHTLLANWRVALATEPAEHPPQAEAPLGRVVAKRFRQAHQTVLHQGRLIDVDSPAEHLHDLRKDAKKLRYIVECFAGAMPGKLHKKFVRQLKGLQDNLGEHQDAEVHADELGVVAHELGDEHSTAETLLALGQLTERLQQTQRDARAEFADRFTAYDSADTARLVDELIDALERR